MVVYALVSLGLFVYALVDLVTAPRADVRTLPKVLWLVVLFVPLLGGAAWLLLGRPRQRRPEASAPPARPAAPDDDEDFLRELRRRRSDPRDDAA